MAQIPNIEHLMADASQADRDAAAAALEAIAAADGMPSLASIGIEHNGPFRAREERFRAQLEDLAAQLYG